MHLFWLMDEALLELITKLQEIAFLVDGLPDFICLGCYKRDSLLADRAFHF
jgi:hypothetical protein